MSHSGICIYMNGSKCAEEYCDYWNNDKLICSLALESHKRTEILTYILDVLDEKKMDDEVKTKLKSFISKLNIIPVSNKLQ